MPNRVYTNPKDLNLNHNVYSMTLYTNAGNWRANPQLYKLILRWQQICNKSNIWSLTSSNCSMDFHIIITLAQNTFYSNTPTLTIELYSLILTRPRSSSRVNMTMVVVRCSQIIRQKSPNVSGSGPCRNKPTGHVHHRKTAALVKCFRSKILTQLVRTECEYFWCAYCIRMNQNRHAYRT